MFPRSRQYKLASGTPLVSAHEVVVDATFAIVLIIAIIDIAVVYCVALIAVVVDEDAVTSCCSCDCRFICR